MSLNVVMTVHQWTSSCVPMSAVGVGVAPLGVILCSRGRHIHHTPFLSHQMSRPQSGDCKGPVSSSVTSTAHQWTPSGVPIPTVGVGVAPLGVVVCSRGRHLDRTPFLSHQLSRPQSGDCKGPLSASVASTVHQWTPVGVPIPTVGVGVAPLGVVVCSHGRHLDRTPFLSHQMCRPQSGDWPVSSSVALAANMQRLAVSPLPAHALAFDCT